jgi:hypothetical protein
LKGLASEVLLEREGREVERSAEGLGGVTEVAAKSPARSDREDR